MDVQEEEEDDDVEEEDRSQDQEADGHVARGMLCGNLHRKCRTRIPRQAFCASLRSRNAHGHVTSVAFCAEIKRENAVPVSRGKHFVRTCAVEMPMDM